MGGFSGLLRSDTSRVLVRLKSDGSIDSTFDPPPIIANSTRGEEPGAVTLICPQPDGKILIAGQFSRVGNVPHFGPTRLLADGSLDAQFTAETSGDIQQMILDNQGRILVRGLLEGRPGIARLLATEQPPAPAILTWNRIGSRFSFWFFAVGEASYTLEFKQALDENKWTAVDTISGDNALRTLVDPVANGSARFYRIRVE